ncbi:MAG: hypothetical protein Tp1102MES731781_28 [Prokaryotic dsDNA virus sp.]|nr:MAG: hypothetical protein Tp1102MES731781_28 [Prokaryotic dsDNA virus sp.]|tara:strand:+ start:9722 stop:10210 length:489 start_codon:yes stop_codon:yes gene_type:complete
MVKANRTKFKKVDKEEKKKAAVNKATNAFNDYWSDLSESQINKFDEIGYNKDRLLQGYLGDSGALGFKAMMMNKDNFNTIQAKLIINGIKKWANSLFKKDSVKAEKRSAVLPSWKMGSNRGVDDASDKLARERGMENRIVSDTNLAIVKQRTDARKKNKKSD